MTPKNIDDAKDLLDILRALPTLRKGLRHKDPARRNMALQVNMPEANYVTGTDVPPKIARALLIVTRVLVLQELKRLKVKVPARLK